MNKTTISSIIICGAVIISVFILGNSSGGNRGSEINTTDKGTKSLDVLSTSTKIEGALTDNVSLIDGKQIIEIKVRGGYSPQKTIAKTGIPTILRFNTSGTFDCSSSIRIPSLNISKYLEISGSTDIDLGINRSGLLQGSCGMGMYPFQVIFQD